MFHPVVRLFSSEFIPEVVGTSVGVAKKLIFQKLTGATQKPRGKPLSGPRQPFWIIEISNQKLVNLPWA